MKYCIILKKNNNTTFKNSKVKTLSPVGIKMFLSADDNKRLSSM